LSDNNDDDDDDEEEEEEEEEEDLTNITTITTIYHSCGMFGLQCGPHLPDESRVAVPDVRLVAKHRPLKVEVDAIQEVFVYDVQLVRHPRLPLVRAHEHVRRGGTCLERVYIWEYVVCYNTALLFIVVR